MMTLTAGLIDVFADAPLDFIVLRGTLQV